MVAKWKKRTFVHDAPMGPKDPRSTVLTVEEEAIAVAFRKHTLLPLGDCLYGLQATIPHLMRSSLHRRYHYETHNPHNVIQISPTRDHTLTSITSDNRDEAQLLALLTLTL